MTFIRIISSVAAACASQMYMKTKKQGNKMCK